MNVFDRSDMLGESSIVCYLFLHVQKMQCLLLILLFLAGKTSVFVDFYIELDLKFISDMTVSAENWLVLVLGVKLLHSCKL